MPRYTDEMHANALVEVLALLDRLQESGQDYDLDLIRTHVPDKLRTELAPQVAKLNAELRAAGY